MLLLGWILSGALQTVTPLPTIDVTDPQDLALVESVNDTMTAFSGNVTACVDRGGKPETCRCQDPIDLAALRKAFGRLVARHPEWKTQLLSYQYINKEGRNVSGTLVVSNLRRQLDAVKCE